MFSNCCYRNRKVRQFISQINKKRNNSLIFQASLWDNVDLLIDLLQEEHDINCIDSWGRTPIHAAAVSGTAKCLQVLINAGADINRQCGERGENKTALHLCAESGFDGNVKTLLDAQAAFAIKDLNGLTPLDLAMRNGHMECVRLLKDAVGKLK
jgi:ankyrin repeat protein